MITQEHRQSTLDQYYGDNNPSPLSHHIMLINRVFPKQKPCYPRITQPEIYIKLTRAITLQANLKHILDQFITSEAITQVIAECILAVVARHEETMLGATATTLDLARHTESTWDNLGRSL